MKVIGVGDEIEYDGDGQWRPGAAERPTGRYRVILYCSNKDELKAVLALENESATPPPPMGVRWRDEP